MGLIRLALLLALLAPAAAAETTVRVATYAADLSRKGPGLLLRDILDGKDAQVQAAARVIAAAAPDVLVLTGIDWDHDGRALDALAALVESAGHALPHRSAARPNGGMASGMDLDGDGRTGTGDDAQGFGMFAGQGAMAVLARWPLGPVTDHSATLWRDLPGHLMPPETPAEAAAIQRLSSTAHWAVPVDTPGGVLTVLAWAATPPVFDGPEDRNGRRNHDEAVFWLSHLPDGPWVLAGNGNLDPVDGDGRREAFAALLAVAQDPAPRGDWQPPQDGANATHRGDPALDTADWADADGPGNLRADWVLPARGLTVAGAGVLWPDPATPLGATVAAASRHRLVWVDVVLP